MQYPARSTPSPDGGFIVRFRDVPEATVQSDDEDEAFEMAEEALVDTIEYYLEGNAQVPMPSRREEDERMVSLPSDVAAEVERRRAITGQK